MSGGAGDTAEDYAEMDAYMKLVEARDLIEFGMIPVRHYQSSYFRIFVF